MVTSKLEWRFSGLSLSSGIAIPLPPTATKSYLEKSIMQIGTTVMVIRRGRSGGLVRGRIQDLVGCAEGLLFQDWIAGPARQRL